MEEINKINNELIPEMDAAMLRSNMVKVTAALIEAVKQLTAAVEKANNTAEEFNKIEKPSKVVVERKAVKKIPKEPVDKA